MPRCTRLSLEEREELSLGLLAGLSLGRWLRVWSGRPLRFRARCGAIVRGMGLSRCAGTGGSGTN